MDKVNRSCSFDSLLVDFAIWLDEVAHIGYMHTNLQITIWKSNTVQSIINILASRRIDADRINMPQSEPIGLISFRNFEACSLFGQAVISFS